MDLRQVEKQLHDEGFHRTYVWEDGPNRRYGDHTHPVETAHIILEGEMTLTTGGKSTTYRAGERCDVAAGTMHEARMGRQAAVISLARSRSCGRAVNGPVEQLHDV